MRWEDCVKIVFGSGRGVENESEGWGKWRRMVEMTVKRV